MTTSAMSLPQAGRRTGSPGRTLLAALLGFFVVTLDAVVVNVALPAIRTDLGGGLAGLQWVVDGYTLVFAAFLLTAGSLSDRIGAKRAFGLGVVVFVLPSVACGSAPGLEALVVRQLGGALAVAVFGALLTALAGMRVSLLLAAAVTVAAALIGVAGLRVRHRDYPKELN